MRVLLVGEMSGTRNGVEWPPRGTVIDLPDDEAASLCNAGMARPIATDVVEAAVVDDFAVEMRRPLTTGSTEAVVPQVKRGPGRPRKNP